MRNRALRVIAVVSMAAVSLSVPTAARAESCTGLPGSTTGATLEAGGQTVRIPALSGLQLCTQGGGPIGGLPALSTEPSGNCVDPCYSLILTGSPGGGDGYVVLRYYADDQPQQVGVPIPGGGPSTERCLVGVGSPEARSDCEVKLSIDRVPTPRPICLGRFCVPPEGGQYDLNEILEDPCGYFFPQIACFN
ncbi:MAG TPA: hypothetical protein VHI71_07565 [Actinomycetota bacterium]|nr:hypothetical protein [Actinomycetota bacterium]